MRYKEYKEYRNIKFDYVKKIPSHWTICSWRYITKILTDYTANGSFKDLADNVKYLDYKSYARVIRLTDLRKDMKNEGIYVDEDAYNFLGKSSLDGGEFLIANVGAYAGLILQMPSINYKATLGPNMMMAKFNERVLNRFMVHLGQSEYIKQQFSLKANSSSAQPKLNKEDFRSIKFLLPPIEEQEKIVEFLDKKTSEINELIEEKEKLIELLKEKREAIITEAVTKGLDKNVNMKDSGVEWIGEIPEHWGINKIKYSTYVKGRIGWQGLKSDEFIDEGPYLVTGTDFKDGKVNWDTCYHISNERYEEAPPIQLKEKDLLITKDGTIGKIAIVKEKPDKAILNSGIFVTRNIDNSYLTEYMYYILTSNIFDRYIKYMETGSTIKHLYQETFINFSYPLPKLEEQKNIIKYLDEKINIFDKLIEENYLEIDMINNYKKSLISEIVTGKIDVRR